VTARTRVPSPLPDSVPPRPELPITIDPITYPLAHLLLPLAHRPLSIGPRVIPGSRNAFRGSLGDPPGDPLGNPLGRTVRGFCTESAFTRPRHPLRQSGRTLRGSLRHSFLALDHTILVEARICVALRLGGSRDSERPDRHNE
jgi:hypothetical protein